jgi:hypothetical protein
MTFLLIDMGIRVAHPPHTFKLFMDETKDQLEEYLRGLHDLIKCTPLSLPDRDTLLGLSGAAIVILVDPSSVAGRAEFRLHLQDALHPLGLTVTAKKPRKRARETNGNRSNVL